MFEKFTDRARKVMSLAQDEARNLGQMYVGTEHLLLALIKEGDGVAAQALAKLDVTYDETLATVKQLSQDETEPVPGGHIPFTPRTKRVLEAAYRETMTHGQTYIATEHLLLGIVSEGNGRAMDALRAMTIVPAQITGLQERVGSLRTGKDADLFVTDGDPLDYRTKVTAVFIDGRQVI